MAVPKGNFFKELKRRNVIKVAITYAIVAWLVIQIAVATFPFLNLPGWGIPLVIWLSGLGFPIALILAWAFEMSPDGIIRTSSADSKENPLPNDRKKPPTIRLLIGFMLLIIAGQLVYNNYWGKGVSSKNIEKSIAVLPFTNMTGDNAQQHLCDGLTEEIIFRLSMVKGFDKVISRSSVMRYKNSDMSIPEIAKELGVANILTGSFSMSGDKVRITANLLHGESEAIITPYRYDRPYGDIFEIHSEVAHDVAAKLNTSLTENEEKGIKRIPTTNLEAYNLFLQSQYRLDALGMLGFDSIYYEMLNQVSDLDSSFSSAYAAKAQYWIVRGLYTGNLEREIVIKEIEPLLEKSIALDSSDYYVNVFIGYYELWYHWSFKEAVHYLTKAYELNPNLGGTITISILYSALGKSSEAAEFADIIFKNSAYTSNVYSAVVAYYFDGQIEKALKLIDDGIRIFGYEFSEVVNSATKVWNYLGEYSKTAELINKVWGNPIESNPHFLGHLAIAYNNTNRQSEALKYVEKLRELSAEGAVGSPSFYLAMYYANSENIEESFRWLNKAFETREVEMYWLKVNPLFKPLSIDPQWQEMLDKVGFPR